MHSFTLYPDKKVYADLHAAVVEVFVLHDPENNQLKMYAQQAADLYRECADKKALKLFAQKIKELDESVYKEIEKLLK